MRPAIRALPGVYSNDDRNKRGQITPQRPRPAATPDISNPAQFRFDTNQILAANLPERNSLAF